MTDTLQPTPPARVSDWPYHHTAELKDQLKQAKVENAVLKAEITRLKQRIVQLERKVR